MLDCGVLVLAVLAILAYSIQFSNDKVPKGGGYLVVPQRGAEVLLFQLWLFVLWVVGAGHQVVRLLFSLTLFAVPIPSGSRVVWGGRGVVAAQLGVVFSLCIEPEIIGPHPLLSQ